MIASKNTKKVRYGIFRSELTSKIFSRVSVLWSRLLIPVAESKNSNLFLRHVIAFVFLALGCVAAQSQSVNPLVCDGRMFLSQGESNTQLNLVDVASNPAVFSPIGAPAFTEYNAMGYNPVDNFLYAIRARGNPGSDAQLLRIGGDGSVEIVDADPGSPGENGIGNLPARNLYVSGEFAPDGSYYVLAFSSSGVRRMRRIDVSASAISAVGIDLSERIGVNDIAWVGGQSVGAGLYSVTTPETTGGDAEVISINPVTGKVTKIGRTRTNGLRFGALFGSGNNLLGVANGGEGLFSFDLDTGRATRISGAPGSNVNDGAFCPLGRNNFATDLSVTKTNTPESGPDDLQSDIYTPGEVRTYSIVVTNNGPFGSRNISVVDELPLGVNPETASWTCGNEIGGGICNVASGVGAIDATIDLPAGVDGESGGFAASSVTFELTMAVPLDHEGELVNTVVVRQSEQQTETNTENNTAVDADIVPGEVSVEKTLASDGNDNGVADPGEELTYHLTLTNDGPSVTGFGLTDVIDANTVFVSASENGEASGRTIVWRDLEIAADSTLVVVVTVRVADELPAGVSHVANLVHRTDEEPPVCEGPSDANGQCVVTPVPGEVSVEKTLASDGNDNGVADPGEELTYHL
ncbi:putative repeat protein (TIGR01451 family), partial [Labrenzia sp. EL_142]|nr:putative repeat protein (TIGR01451 family) [Labrenzia sp. EL_142]